MLLPLGRLNENVRNIQETSVVPQCSRPFSSVRHYFNYTENIFLLKILLNVVQNT